MQKQLTIDDFSTPQEAARGEEAREEIASMLAVLDDALSTALADTEITKEHAEEAKAVAENELDTRDTEDELERIIDTLDIAERALTNAHHDLALIMTWEKPGDE